MTTEVPSLDTIAASPEIKKEFSSTQGVSLRSVSKKYGAFVAVENLTLDFAAGTYCCLVGLSGRGKTTTLRMIAGHEDVTCTEVLIGDGASATCPLPSATLR